MSVLDIGQHRPWSTGQYAVGIAGHYFRQSTMFLCLQKKNDNEQLMITSCCYTTMHAECIMLVQSVLSRLSFDVVLECGQATYCGCIWTDV